MGRQRVIMGAALAGLFVAIVLVEAPQQAVAPVTHLRATYDGTAPCVQGLDDSGQAHIFSATNFTFMFFNASGNELGGENFEKVLPEHFTGLSLCSGTKFGKQTPVRIEVKGMVDGAWMEASS